jgi:hypothetical protein
MPMNPRKKESKKWTQLPADFSKQIKTVFEENFKAQLQGKKLTVEGRIYPAEIMLRVGFQEKGEIRYHNFEVSLDHSKEKQNTISQIHLGVDAIASLMADYFENQEDHEMPLAWQEYPFQNQTLWLQYTSENSDLEAEANKLLGIEKGSLLNDAEEEDDEDIDMSQPQIFGGGKKKKDEMH